MGWEELHDKRVAALPANVREAHKHWIHHCDEIVASTVCGCFQCCATFPPHEIAEWTDHDDTALCPKCGIDSVIGDRSGIPVSGEVLALMKARWF